MAPRKSKVPTPEELLEEVSGKSAAKTYPFEDYMQAVHVMKTDKGYSFAEIAEYLSGRLGGEFTKGQVYRGYQLWLDRKEQEEHEEAEYQAMRPPPDDDDWTDARNAKIEALADKAADMLGDLCDEESALRITAGEIMACLQSRAAQRAADERAADEADAKLEAKKAEERK